MIDSRYLKYIPIEDHEYYRNILLKDVYYFYHGIKINDDVKIICKNGNELDLSRENLTLSFRRFSTNQMK
jgi:hypothetical protein